FCAAGGGRVDRHSGQARLPASQILVRRRPRVLPPMTATIARRAAWAALALTVGSIPLSTYLLSRPLITPLTTKELLSVAVACIGTFASAAVGALIVSRHPRHPSGCIFSLSGPANVVEIVLAAHL